MSALDLPPEALPIVATILLDAALADGVFDGDEQEAIRSLLCEVGGFDGLPADVVAALKDFDPATFSLEDAVSELGLESRIDKRELLALVGLVIAADGSLEEREDAWLVRFATALGRRERQIARLREEILNAAKELSQG